MSLSAKIIGDRLAVRNAACFRRSSVPDHPDVGSARHHPMRCQPGTRGKITTHTICEGTVLVRACLKGLKFCVQHLRRRLP